MPSPVLLSDLTTLRLGGPAPDLTTALTAQDVADAVGAADRQGNGVLVLGGGSNLVVADEGIDVPIVRIGIRGIRIERSDDDGAALVTIGAGESWDDVVAELTAAGFAELATLSGIPGSTGATPVQNVGAYGTEIAEVLHSVTVYDRKTGVLRSIPAAELALSYRSSMLRGTDAAVVTDITMRLSDRPVALRYGELTRALGVEPGGTRTAGRRSAGGARSAPRQGHGARPGRTPDTYSAGSFFTNPILDADHAERVDRTIRSRLGADAGYPRYPVTPPAPAGAVKLSAAWLIERAGFPKGYPGSWRPGRGVQQTHPGADQPRRQHGRPDRAGPARSGTECAPRSG